MQLERRYISEVRIDEPISSESYLSRIPVIKYLQNNHSIEFNSNITIIVGENGTGKSTLMEAIAVAVKLNPEGGSSRHTFSTKDTHSELYRKLIVSKQNFPRDKFFLRAESTYNMASYFQNLAEDPLTGRFKYLWDKLHKMSHGEGFLDILCKFRGNGLYLMDEPESALSPTKLMEAMCMINQLLNKESQFIIATHSPMLMAFPNAQILQLTDKGIEEVNYRDTDHYKITMDFLLNPERMFDILFEDNTETA